MLEIEVIWKNSLGCGAGSRAGRFETRGLFLYFQGFFDQLLLEPGHGFPAFGTVGYVKPDVSGIVPAQHIIHEFRFQETGHRANIGKIWIFSIFFVFVPGKLH